VDLAGNVVGINTAGTTEAENVGFAIQINSVKPTIFQAADNPDAPVAYMGILGPVDVSDPQVQFQLDTPVDEGVLIQDVAPDGPAEQAGVQAGDIVVEFDGEPMTTAEGLGEAIRSHEPGDRVDVVIVRAGGDRVTVTVELGVAPIPLG
jgi:S1-C subfamily serine protease